jgi:hypothetical protein
MTKKITIDQICKGLRIPKKYHPDAFVCGSDNATKTLFLQELEFENITAEDRAELLSLYWKNNGPYSWYI